MRLSRRVTGLLGEGSDGWEVFYRARQMIAEGIAVTELTIGEHDIRTAAPILREMHRAALAGHTGYAAVPGTAALRAAVAARIADRTGVATGPENVLITPGGQAALFAAHVAACDPGDVALFVEPYYVTYPGTLRGAGAVPRAIETRAEDAFQPRAEALAAAAAGARSLLVNSPNNPTGVVYSEATLRGIADVCTAQDLWLISDEVYDSQVWEGAHLSPRALPGMAERTLVVGSMSKSHAMTGSRCGWIVGPEEVIGHLVDLATHTTYGVPGYIQDASVYALGLGPAFEAEIAEPFRRRRAAAQALIARQEVVRLVPAQGAMYLMLDVRATGMSGLGFAFDLLETEHIAVMPGESFGRSAAGHVRVAMTIGDAAFAATLERVLAHAARRAGSARATG
jgi:arginine:pyruvate transaminase